MIERTRMYCHACNQDFVAELDMELTGNHEIRCAHCNHIHYRVVENGRVTGDRWRSSMQTFYASSTTATITMTASSSSTLFLSGSWLNSGGSASTGVW